MTIGERIRKKRKSSGMTMAQLGKQIGVTAAAISRYELGQRDLTIDTLQAIANALGVHIFDLVGIGDKMKQFKVEYDDIKPISGNPEDWTPERKAEIEKILLEDVATTYDNVTEEDKKDFWKILVEGGIVSQLYLGSSRERLYLILDQMDEEGRRKVEDYAEDILPRHRRQEAPQPPAEASRDTDTPAPQNAPEGPQEGE